MSKSLRSSILTFAVLGVLCSSACNRDVRPAQIPEVNVMAWSDVKSEIATTEGKLVVLDLWALW